MSDTPSIYQRPEYARLVDERNAARRELAEAEAWMREARVYLRRADRWTMASADALAQRCPLPRDEDAR